MSRQIKHRRFWADLALVISMVTGGRAVEAAGIRITSGSTEQTGDPTYAYVFTVDLLAGSTLDQGGFFTVYDLPNMNPNLLLSSQPSSNWGSLFQLIGITPSGAVVNDNPNLYNVTWMWNGASPIVAGTSDLFLGTFKAGVTNEMTSPPSATVVYVGSVDGTTASNQGTVAINSIPEPSSVILLMIGAAALPVCAVGHRKRTRSA
jgi:hypothetical protein